MPGADRALTLVRAPDPEEEVRCAVREVAGLLEAAPSSKVAFAVATQSPHRLIVHERLSAAGIELHGKSPYSLAQTRLGRAMLASTHRDEQARSDLAAAMALRHPRVGRVGRGVFVGDLEEVAGNVSAWDLVLVVGLSQAAPRGAARQVEIVLKGCPRVILCTHRADPRAGRAMLPSPAWSSALATVVGHPVDVTELSSISHPGFLDVPSFVAGAAAASHPADSTEGNVKALLAAVGAGGRAAARSTLSSTSETMARSIEAGEHRRVGRLSPWNGDVGQIAAHLFSGEASQVGSATRFERWATCPFRYFLEQVLQLDAGVDASSEDSVSGLDRGSLAHAALERFHGERLGRDPHEPFSDSEVSGVEEVVVEMAAAIEADPTEDPSLLWELTSAAMSRRLESLLLADAAYRAEVGVAPIAVEHRFGLDGAVEGSAPPVEVEISPGRRVLLRGAVDRIDASPDRSRSVVLDYKTGSDRRYSSLARRGRASGGDLTSSGQHLQLLLYAAAARAMLGPEASLEAYYWFVDSGGSASMRGGPVGDEELERLAEVLALIVEGIESGLFPANPGEETWFGPSHCGHCPFDRACPPSRVEQWEALRADPGVETYVKLAGGR